MNKNIYTGKTVDREGIYAAECIFGGWDVWVQSEKPDLRFTDEDGWQYGGHFDTLPEWVTQG